MKIRWFQLHGVRCFEETGQIALSPKWNIFIGTNNSGKSTLMQGITAWQFFPFHPLSDVRPGRELVHKIEFAELKAGNHRFKSFSDVPDTTMKIEFDGRSVMWNYGNGQSGSFGNDTRFFDTKWPNAPIIPFIAKRKAQSYGEGVSTQFQGTFDGTFANLYARVDRVVSPGASAHQAYKRAVESIVGVFITTRASDGGKQAGYYFDDDHFVTLDKMGDGIAEIVALIVELSLAKDKIFVLEEPETNLHPDGLKALLGLMRESGGRNQFVIATHSNVVVRELAGAETYLFRVYREGNLPSNPSKVARVEDTPEAHRQLLRELGYEFGDFDLYEGWLFLEEASAETVIKKILIPWFAPNLLGRLRTFSAAGADNLEPSVSEFQRLVTFVHLQPVYRERLWIRADGDVKGRAAIREIQKKFSYLAAPRADNFLEGDFEAYYPSAFSADVQAIKNLNDKTQKRAAKAALLKKVIGWTTADEQRSRPEWEKSAHEQIELLMEIDKTLSR